MTDVEAEDGLLRYKRDQRRRTLSYLVSLAIAGIGGGLLAYVLNLAKASPGGLDGSTAIVLALLFVATMMAANWLYLRSADELTWAINIRASFWALMFFVALYPVWLILWTGGLVPKPDAETLYFLTLLVAGAAFLWNRFR